MEQIEEFHDHAILILLIIFFRLSVVFFYMTMEKNFDYKLVRREMTEIIWTSLPVFILLFLAIPSIQVLFLIEELIRPVLTIKVIGQQWLWSYEYSDFHSNKSNIFTETMRRGAKIFRSLQVEKRNLYLPFLTQIRLLVTSEDVIHSWTIPSMGVKVDANPGRLNRASIFRFRRGYFFGQCSEICGVNHAYMPIKTRFVRNELFKVLI